MHANMGLPEIFDKLGVAPLLDIPEYHIKLIIYPTNISHLISLCHSVAIVVEIPIWASSKHGI